jgi:hypothetical protein
MAEPATVNLRKWWRDVLKVHPAAELFPPMSPDELQALGEDIKANGLTAPIIVWKRGSRYQKGPRGRDIDMPPA